MTARERTTNDGNWTPTPMHLNEEDLVLHYYGEMDAAAEARAAAHLAECGMCHGSYTRLQRVLTAVERVARETMR